MEGNSPLALAVEIGGTKLQAALGRPDGEILETIRGKAPSEHGAEAILEWFARELPPFLKRAAQFGGSVQGIGVGFGGPVETAAGKVICSNQVEGWDGFPLRRWFAERFGLPVHIENDTQAGAWAEYKNGSGRGTRSFFYMNIGSGIGGGLVVDGRLYDGQGFGAAEIGHSYIPDWTARTPGAAIKLEHMCSGWSIERRVRGGAAPPPESPLGRLCGGDPAVITCAMLAEAACGGDAIALGEINRVAQSLGYALANLIALFHPERIALGGGVSLMGDVLVDRVREWAARYDYAPFHGKYSIGQCDLGETIVLTGGLLLAPAG